MDRRDELRAPDGTRWRVRRQWSDRPLPDPRRRFRANLDKERGGSLLDLWQFDALDSIWVTVALVGATLLIVFVLLPLIGVALELIAVLVLIGSGILGRLILRRPWTVEAMNLDDPERSAEYPVKGWRRSGEAVKTLRQEIAATGSPTPPPGAEELPSGAMQG